MNLNRLKFLRVWKTNDDRLISKVEELWKTVAQLQMEQITQRKKELLMVVMDGEKVVGVSTAFIAQSRLLNNNYFYRFRFFIRPDYRIAGLNNKLLFESSHYLEELAQTEENPPIGILIFLENPMFSESSARSSVWRIVPYVFAGYTKDGYPIRVYYFKNVRI